MGIFGPKAVASTSPPPKQCVGCGKRVKPHGFAGINHCSKPKCAAKAARMIDRMYGGE